MKCSTYSEQTPIDSLLLHVVCMCENIVTDIIFVLPHRTTSQYRLGSLSIENSKFVYRVQNSIVIVARKKCTSSKL